jgi:Na+-transporting methylmalonyl-CoA/oxaloacetate decarboxylase gamma subunit
MALSSSSMIGEGPNAVIGGLVVLLPVLVIVVYVLRERRRTVIRYVKKKNLI